MEISKLELIAILLSRELHDGQLVMTGNAATVPLCAATCAKLLRGPNITIISGSLGTVNPTNPLLDRSCGCYQARKAECFLPYSILDVDFLLARRQVDVLFLSGLQIDKRGSVNLVCIGPYHRPILRGPGSIGAPFSRLVENVFVYLERHNRSTLVNEVDFVSSPGYLQKQREHQNCPKNIFGLPKLIVTPLCTMDFDYHEGSLRLKSLHGGVTLAEVLDNTGFDLFIPDAISTTQMPIAEEIETVRKIDFRGLLRA